MSTTDTNHFEGGYDECLIWLLRRKSELSAIYVDIDGVRMNKI